MKRSMESNPARLPLQRRSPTSVLDPLHADFFPFEKYFEPPPPSTDPAVSRQQYLKARLQQMQETLRIKVRLQILLETERDRTRAADQGEVAQALLGLATAPASAVSAASAAASFSPPSHAKKRVTPCPTENHPL